MDKTVSVKGTEITFSIWDLGGQKEFLNMLPLVCNDALAILFMFDLTRSATLVSVKDWYRQARAINKVRKHHFLSISQKINVSQRSDNEPDRQGDPHRNKI